MFFGKKKQEKFIIQSEGKFSEEDKKQAAYALNLCTVSVSQIIDYSDLNILEQEYEAILNNINLENIPKDDELLHILEKLLDTITFFRIQEGKKKFIDLEYQQKMKNAIWSAVPNIGLLVSGGNFVTTLISLASQVGIGYMNYRKTKASNSLEYEKNLWELESNAIEQFNALRRELFSTAWRLADKYNFVDSYRLTEKQIKEYNEILMDPDNVRKYQRLVSIKENFNAYPPFWYYLGSAANAIAQDALQTVSYYKNIESSEELSEKDQENKNNATEVFQRFKIIAENYFKKYFYENGDSVSEKNCDFREYNKYSILREDLLAASCALEYAELLDVENENDIKEIINLYKIAEKYAPNDNDVLELCAIGYIKVGNISDAERLLLNLVNKGYNKIVNVQILSRLDVVNYISCTNEMDKEKYKINHQLLSSRVNPNFVYPWIEKETQLEDANSLFIDRQKAILIKKIIFVLSEIRIKYMILYNRIIPVPYPNRYYSDEYFYDSEESKKRRLISISEILANRKEVMRYISDLSNVNFALDILDVLNLLFEDLHKLIIKKQEYSFLDENDFDSLKKSVETKLKDKKDELINSSKYICNADMKCEFKDDKDSLPPTTFDFEKLKILINITYTELTKDLYEELLNDIYQTIQSINTIGEISEADSFIINWAKECSIEIKQDDFYIEETKKEKLPTFDEYIFDGELKEERRKKEILQNCQNIIKNAQLLKTETKWLKLYVEKKEDNFKNYLYRINKKYRATKNKVENVFAIINDKSLSDCDLILSLDGVYLVKYGGLHDPVSYEEIEWDDANKKRLNIGSHKYENKAINLPALLDAFKDIAKLDIKVTEKNKFNKELKDSRYNKFFDKLQAVVTPVSDNIKLLLADYNA